MIEGGHTLSGTVSIGGNKNAVLKLMAACLLTPDPVVLHNVPDIGDVRTMSDILRALGAKVERRTDNGLLIHADNIHTTQVDPALSQKMRASIVLAGPLLARFGNVRVMPPGGDQIGRRRLDTHLLALEKLGAHIEVDRGFNMNADGLHGADIFLDEASVTATENALMATALARGESVIRNAACEPHVQDLANLIRAMGGSVEGVGTNQLTIRGAESLHGCEFRVGADFIEAGSFIGAAAMNGGEVRIQNAGTEHLGVILMIFEKLGVHCEIDGDDVIVPGGQQMQIRTDLGRKIPEVKAQPWPAFPTDLMSIVLTVATQCSGAIMFHEWMYDARLYFTDKLVGMGARIILCDPHRAIVQGRARLRGDTTLTSPDIRAGIAMLLAALTARGTTTIRNIHHIDRAYEQIDRKLTALGAKINRVSE